MAQPLLRTSGLARTPRDTTGESWARGLTQVAKGISSGLQNRWERKQKEKNEFINAMDYDINSVSNDLFKGYAVDQYNTFRDNWVKTFKDQKGWLTPEQKILMQSDMVSLQRSVEYLNALSEMNDRAMQMAQKDPRVTYKAEDWGRILQLMKPGDKYNPEAIKEAGSLFMSSDANIPGTVLTPMNPDDAFIELAPTLRKNLPKEEMGFGVEQMKKGGIRYEVPYTEVSYGTPDELVNLATGELSKTGFVNNVDKSLANILTPEQQRAAILENGNVPGALSKYYYQNLLPEDIKSEILGPKRDYATARRIPEDTGPGGSGIYTTIRETDIGWEFGTTPIALSKKIDGETYKNASVVGIKKQNGDYVAQMIVPKGKNESMQKIIEKRSAEQGRDLTNQETAMIVEELLSGDRYKTVEVPLEGIYDELKSAFSKKKLNLEGYNQIIFPEEVDDWSKYLRN